MLLSIPSSGVYHSPSSPVPTRQLVHVKLSVSRLFSLLSVYIFFGSRYFFFFPFVGFEQTTITTTTTSAYYYLSFCCSPKRQQQTMPRQNKPVHSLYSLDRWFWFFFIFIPLLIPKLSVFPSLYFFTIVQRRRRRRMRCNAKSTPREKKKRKSRGQVDIDEFQHGFVWQDQFLSLSLSTNHVGFCR